MTDCGRIPVSLIATVSRVSESKIHVEGTELEERYLKNT